MAADGIQLAGELLLEVKVDLLPADVNDVKMLLRGQFAGRRGIAIDSGGGGIDRDGLRGVGLSDGGHDGKYSEKESVRRWEMDKMVLGEPKIVISKGRLVFSGSLQMVMMYVLVI